MLRTANTWHVPTLAARLAEGGRIGVSIMASRVRQNAPSAAIAAVLMIYFGFFVLAKPAGADLFHRAALVFCFTLRIGGIIMALIAVGSLVGHRVVLLVDGIASPAIGALFVLSALAMLFDGGGAFNCGLYVVFGAMFVSAGVRNWREYFALARSAELSHPIDPVGNRADAMTTASRISATNDVPTPAGVAQLGLPIDSSPEAAQIDSAPAEALPDESPPTAWPAQHDDDPYEMQDKPDDHPVSEGFLASFGDEDAPPRI